jgi:hypothetical protein
MTTPAQRAEIAAEEMESEESLRRLDRAYGCYAYVGLFIMAAAAIVMHVSGENWEGYAIGLILPALLFPVALVVAFAQSARLRRHRILVVLGLSTLFLVALTVAGVFRRCCEERPSERASYAVFVLYGAAVALVPSWWFAAGRWRYRKSLGSNPH